uniref:(northern house mosquito) hypothetical protein n=1 Tax=Culex pipiens TaxID=7175 RepID=A0A8D8FNK6_CULPI
MTRRTARTLRFRTCRFRVASSSLPVRTRCAFRRIWCVMGPGTVWTDRTRRLGAWTWRTSARASCARTSTAFRVTTGFVTGLTIVETGRMRRTASSGVRWSTGSSSVLTTALAWI